jgi:ATP phosphoribosyltransferase|tara:strand:+ start:1427 stop:2035 length:609 start_codon:yes stop_codon:yes gene_type:complete
MLIALPKGRLLPEIKKLFLKVGIEFDSDSRKLIIDTSNENFKVAILRTWDIPKFVNYGAADIGIVGKDILYETNLDNNYYEILDLKLGLCRMSLASLSNDLPKNKKLKVASKYPTFAKDYFSNLSRDIDLLILKGAIEIAPILGLSDCIVDLVQTGKTLEENGLKELEEISEISSRLIVNKSSFKSKNKIISNLATLIEKEL